MGGQVNIGGVWKNINGVYVNIGGTWKTASALKCNIGGVWKDGWNNIDSYTKSLLHFDGTDGSTAFIDEAGKTWTAYGNAQIDTAQKKFGTASGLFDGSGDYIYVSDHADWDFETSDFTIDFCVRFNSLPSSGNIAVMVARGKTGGGDMILVRMANVSGTMKLVVRLNNIESAPNWSPSLNTWYHVAVTRSSGTLRIFIDGSKIGSDYANAGDVNDSTALLVGAAGSVAGEGLNGWIDEFRISKGIARWTSNFTPPTEPY